MSDDSMLQEQVAYYRARAAEYDEWFRPIETPITRIAAERLTVSLTIRNT